MFYIKMTADKELQITQSEPIYRGENLHTKMTFLIPHMLGTLDTRTACIYMSYIKADASADVVRMIREELPYDDTYDCYKVPIGCKMTKYPGEVHLWLQIYAGDLVNTVIAKSGECVVRVQNSTNMDDCMCDHQLFAIYQLQKEIEDGDSEWDPLNGTGGSGGSGSGSGGSGGNSGDSEYEWEGM